MNHALPAPVAPRRLLLLLLIPGLLTLGITFAAPLVWLVRASFSDPDSVFSLSAPWSSASYSTVLFDPFYWRVARNTLWLGLGVSLPAVVLAYPIALFLHRSTSRWKGVLTALAIAPLLTSSVVRTYGWMVLLGDLVSSGNV